MRRRLSLYGGILYYLFGAAVININISIAIDTPPSFFVEQSERKCNFGAASFCAQMIVYFIDC